MKEQKIIISENISFITTKYDICYNSIIHIPSPFFFLFFFWHKHIDFCWKTELVYGIWVFSYGIQSI